MEKYEYTNKWFKNGTEANWTSLFKKTKPRKILEIGSYEGASTCFLIERLSNYHDSLEIHAIDTWEGGLEHIDAKIDIICR